MLCNDLIFETLNHEQPHRLKNKKSKGNSRNLNSNITVKKKKNSWSRRKNIYKIIQVEKKENDIKTIFKRHQYEYA